MTDTAYITKFEAYLLTEQRASLHTIGAYKRDLNQLSLFLAQSSSSFIQASIYDLRSFIHTLVPLKSSTRARKVASIKIFYRYLQNYCNIPNQAHALVIPKRDMILPRYLTFDEIKSIFASLSLDTTDVGLRNKTIVYLLYATGIRVSELVNLKFSDIDSTNGVIRITSGKRAKQRLIPVSQEVGALCSTYRTTLHNKQTGFVFAHDAHSAQPLTRQQVWHIVKTICKKAGIDRSISPHQLRHSFATHLLKEGVDLKSLQVLLGHENLNTVQIYTHIEKTVLRSLYDRIHPRSR